jgi:hypothetical protein
MKETIAGSTKSTAVEASQSCGDSSICTPVLRPRSRLLSSRSPTARCIDVDPPVVVLVEGGVALCDNLQFLTRQEIQQGPLRVEGRPDALKENAGVIEALKTVKQRVVKPARS